MEPGRSMPHSQGSTIISILSPTNPIPHIDTYIFKVHVNISSNICLDLSKSLFPVGVPDLPNSIC